MKLHDGVDVCRQRPRQVDHSANRRLNFEREAVICGESNVAGHERRDVNADREELARLEERVTVTHDFGNLEEAKAFIESPRLKEAMAAIEHYEAQLAINADGPASDEQGPAITI